MVGIEKTGAERPVSLYAPFTDQRVAVNPVFGDTLVTVGRTA